MEARGLTRLEPRPYQQDTLDTVAKFRSSLIAWDMGTGKTLLAVELMRLIREGKENPRIRALIVAPLNTHRSWKETIARQLGPEVAIYTVGTPGQDPTTWKGMVGGFKLPGIFIIGWEAMAGWVEAVKDPHTNEVIKEISHIPPWQHTGEWDLVVADECHRMQNRRSLAAKVMTSIKSERRVAMSGTPAGNRKEGIWSILHWLWPSKYPHYWPWVNETMKTEPCPYAHIKVVGELEPGSTIRGIPSYHRLELREVNDQLPEVVERIIEVEMTPKQAKTYQSFLDRAFAWLEEQPVATPLPITQRIRLRQVALGNPSAVQIVEEDGQEKIEVFFKKTSTSLKISAIKQILEDLPEDEPVMIYTHSKRFVEPVVHQLGKRAVAWTGDTKQDERHQIMDSFGKPGGPLYIVAVIAAISEGTDGLQRLCANEIWLSKDDNNILNEQCKARLLRTGQERIVNRWYLHSRNTIDEGVYAKTSENTITMQDFYRGEES